MQTSSRSLYIGGEFSSRDLRTLWQPPGQKSSFEARFPERIGQKSIIWLETGSDALAAIFWEIAPEGPLQVWVPENYCMSSLNRALLKWEAARRSIPGPSSEIRTYRLTSEIRTEPNRPSAVIALHFNRLQPELINEVLELRRKLGFFIIEDFVMASFEIRKLRGDYGFNSLRKVAPIEAAVAYLRKPDIVPARRGAAYLAMRERARAIKTQFISSRRPALEMKYLTLFTKAEKYLHEDATIRIAQPGEIKKARRADWERLLRVRKRNFKALRSKLDRISGIRALPGQYMFLMLETSRRDALRGLLFSQGIFPAIHWLDSGSKISRRILSFHIDQRYTARDMDRVAAAIRVYNRQSS